MRIKNIKQTIFNEKMRVGQISFFSGVFFLPSAIAISGILFLISLLISITINYKLFLKDKYNKFLLLCSGIIIFSSINSIINLNDITQQNKYFVGIGLINWIPFFILFATSQIYLKTPEQRKIFSKVIISGTIPVLISCFLQYQLKIYGPFEILNGLIVWFQKPIAINAGVTGLFNNQNYTGLWLSSILPFSINELKVVYREPLKKYILLLINLSIGYYLFLTTSRNAFLGLIFVLLTQLRVKYFLLLSAIFSFLFFIYNFINKISLNNLITTNNLLFRKIFFGLFELKNRFIDLERLHIYKSTIRLINEQPFFGWGPSTFGNIYKLRNIDWNVSYQHAHSLILDIAYNFGIPFAILIVIFIFKLITDTIIRIYKNTSKKENYLINNSWLVTTLVVIISQIFDVTYYDGKIGILIWILLAGLKCIIEEEKSESILSN